MNKNTSLKPVKAEPFKHIPQCVPCLLFILFDIERYHTPSLIPPRWFLNFHILNIPSFYLFLASLRYSNNVSTIAFLFIGDKFVPVETINCPKNIPLSPFFF